MSFKSQHFVIDKANDCVICYLLNSALYLNELFSCVLFELNKKNCDIQIVRFFCHF
jgi:hypothetical protein